MNRWRGWLVVGLTTFFATMACATVGRLSPLVAPTAAPVAAPEQTAITRHLKVLEAVDTTVREQYVRADLDGVDWEAFVQETRAQIETGLSEDEFAAAMRTLVQRLPADNAIFRTRAERIETELTDTSNYEGIGVYYGFRIQPEPRVVVLVVMEGSPAEKAGLKPHDAIYAIDGQAIAPDERATVSQRIRGPAGSAVTLLVQTPGEARREVVIERGQITASDSLRAGTVNGTDIAYYRIPVAATAEMAELIAEDLYQRAQQNPPTGIILDLRTARAFGPWPLEGMLKVFASGSLGEFYTRTQTETVVIEGQDFGGSQTLPLVVLIGPDTEGAAEVFAGALQGSGRATLIGLPSPGTIEGFDEFDLPDGSRLGLATASYRLADGTDFSNTGLIPDVLVESDWDSFGVDGGDPVIQAALKALGQP